MQHNDTNICAIPSWFQQIPLFHSTYKCTKKVEKGKGKRDIVVSNGSFLPAVPKRVRPSTDSDALLSIARRGKSSVRIKDRTLFPKRQDRAQLALS